MSLTNRKIEEKNLEINQLKEKLKSIQAEMKDMQNKNWVRNRRIARKLRNSILVAEQLLEKRLQLTRILRFKNCYDKIMMRFKDDEEKTKVIKQFSSYKSVKKDNEKLDKEIENIKQKLDSPIDLQSDIFEWEKKYSR